MCFFFLSWHWLCNEACAVNFQFLNDVTTLTIYFALLYTEVHVQITKPKTQMPNKEVFKPLHIQVQLIYFENLLIPNTLMNSSVAAVNNLKLLLSHH